MEVLIAVGQQGAILRQMPRHLIERGINQNLPGMPRSVQATRW